MTTIEPRKPQRGWLLRWLSQGAELVLRAFPQLLVGTVIGNVALMTIVAMSNRIPLVQSDARQTIGLILSMPLFYFYTFGVYHLLMRADGRRAPFRLLSAQSLKSKFPPLVGAIGVVALFTLISAVWPSSDMGAAFVPTFDDDSSSVYRFVVICGLLFAIGNVFTMVVLGMVGPFWQALQVGMGIGFGTYLSHLLPLLVTRMPFLAGGITAFSAVGAMVLIVLPFWLAQIGVLIMIGWFYVGAREIFGGMLENGAHRSVFSRLRLEDASAEASKTAG